MKKLTKKLIPIVLSMTLATGCSVVKATYEYASNLFSQQKYEEASKAYTNYANNHPESELTYNAKALAFLAWINTPNVRSLKTLDLMKDLCDMKKQSELKFSDPLLKKPDISKFLEGISYMYEENGCKSLPHFKQVIKKYPNTDSAIFSAVIYYYKSNSCPEKKEKIDYLKQITQEHKGKKVAAAAHYLLGDHYEDLAENYEEQEDIDSAITHFTIIKDNYPDLRPIMRNDALRRLSDLERGAYNQNDY